MLNIMEWMQRIFEKTTGTPPGLSLKITDQILGIEELMPGIMKWMQSIFEITTGTVVLPLKIIDQILDIVESTPGIAQ